MTSFYGDIIAPDLNLFVAAEKYTAEQLGEELNRLSDFASKIDLSDIWSSTKLFGIFCAAGEARLGISLNFACKFGIGFIRDYYLCPAIDEYYLSLTKEQGLAPHKKQMALYHVEKSKKESLIRGPEVDAIKKIYGTVVDKLFFPIKLETNLQGGWCYDFDVAYRRSLSYAIAYEASIKSNSLDCYQKYLDSLILDYFEKFSKKCPASDSKYGFSVFLNLLWIIKGAFQYQNDHDEVHEIIPGHILDYDTKERFLKDMLLESAKFKMSSVNEDGKIAIKALLHEVEEKNNFPYMTTWGELGESNLYFK